MKIWIIDNQPFKSKRDADLYADVHYRRIWGEQFTTPYPNSWKDAYAHLTWQNIEDVQLIDIVEHDLPISWDDFQPDGIFGVSYSAEDMIGNIEGFDPALHRATFDEWAQAVAGEIENAMTEAAWEGFPHDIEDLMDPGAYWRWDKTGDYETWAEEQRK